MKRGLMGALLCALAVFALRGAAAPSGEDVIKQMYQTYRALKSYDGIALERLTVTVNGQEQPAREVKHRFVFKAPNLFYYDSEFTVNRMAIKVVNASDGKTVLTHQKTPRADFGMTSAAPAALDGAEDVLTLLEISTESDPFAFLCGKDPLVDVKVDSIIEGTLDGKPIYEVALSRGEDLKMVFSIGRDDHLLYRTRRQHTRTQGDNKIVITVTETHSNIKVDGDVDNKIFAYQIPAAARVRTVTSPLGKPLPPIKLKDVNGKEVDVNALKGKVVIVNFWAHW